MLDDWDHLRYVLALARKRTLAGAARELAVQHTTVARRLDAIEAGLGVRLFTRTPDGFVPTEVGADIATMAEQVEAVAHAVERRASGEDARVEGVVRVTTSEAFSGFIVRRLGPLQERHPRLVVEVVTTNQALDLSRHEADIAIRLVPPGDANLVGRRCMSVGWSLFAAPGYVARKGPLAREDDLAGHDVVGFDEAMSRTPGAVYLSEHAAGAHVALRSNSLMSALNAAIVGMGVACIPCFLAEGQGLVRMTTKVVGGRDLWLVAHPNLVKVGRVRAVLDYLVEVMDREHDLLRGHVPGG